MTASLAGIAAAVALILRFPSAQYAFYPRCPVYNYLHLQCPGCGATRAFAALLHGHLAEAIHLNALFIGLLPLLTAYAAWSGYRAWTCDTFRWPELRPRVTYVLLGIALVFTIARNLQS